MGPKWPFLLMYGSHDMRHTGFRKLTSCQQDPRDSGRHSYDYACCRCGFFLEINLPDISSKVPRFNQSFYQEF